MPTAAFAQSFALGKGTYPLEFYDIDFSRLAQWRIMTNVSLFAEYLHELAGPAITLAGAHGADVGIVQIDANF